MKEMALKADTKDLGFDKLNFVSMLEKTILEQTMMMIMMMTILSGLNQLL